MEVIYSVEQNLTQPGILFTQLFNASKLLITHLFNGITYACIVQKALLAVVVFCRREFKRVFVDQAFEFLARIHDGDKIDMKQCIFMTTIAVAMIPN